MLSKKLIFSLELSLNNCFRRRIMERFQREVMGIKEPQENPLSGNKREREEINLGPQYEIQVRLTL